MNQFFQLYQQGNLRKASELLGISHSGLSKSMSALRDEIGEELFIQSGRGISFTDRGHELASEIPNFLKSFEALVKSGQSNEKRRIKLGSFEVFTTYFSEVLGPLLDEYELDFHELVPGKMEKALLNRDIDVAITYEPILLPGIEHLKVCEIEMNAFVKKGAFKGEPILEIPFAAPLIPVEGAPSGNKGLDSWPDQKFKRIIKYKVDLMETAISLARQGHCAVFLPQFVANLHNKIVRDEYILTKKATPKGMKTIKRSVYIVKRESTIEDSIIKKIAKYLRNL